MEIRKMPNIDTDENFFMHSMFEDILNEKGIDGTFNYVEIAGNVNLPDEGWSVHDYDEFSLILEGEVDSEIDGKNYTVKAGDYTLIKKGTPHKTFNRKNEPCKIISLLI